MQIDGDTLDGFSHDCSSEPLFSHLLLSKVMGWLVFCLAVSHCEFVSITVVFNNVYHIFSLFNSVEIRDNVDFGEVFNTCGGFKFFNFLSDFYHKSLVVVLRVFVDLDGINNTVEAALAIEDTEGLVNIDSINGLFVGHQLFKEHIGSSICL